MNIPRATLQRRRFLQSGSYLVLGAASSVLAVRKLIDRPDVPQPASRPLVKAEPRPEPPAPKPETIAKTDEPAAPPAKKRPAYIPNGRPLENELEYVDFLRSLDLRHLTPHEIIDPHRGVMNGVANRLPPLEMWEELGPTLKVADEIRDRLELPLARITSAFRAPEYNAVIPGAVRGSYHTRNQALDLVYHCSSRKAYGMAMQLRREGFFRGGVGLYPTFIHLDTRGYAATWRRV